MSWSKTINTPTKDAALASLDSDGNIPANVRPIIAGAINLMPDSTAHDIVVTTSGHIDERGGNMTLSVQLAQRATMGGSARNVTNDDIRRVNPNAKMTVEERQGARNPVPNAGAQVGVEGVGATPGTAGNQESPEKPGDPALRSDLHKPGTVMTEHASTGYKQGDDREKPDGHGN